MGIDRHCFNFLRYVKNSKEFGSTITVGRQSMYVSTKLLASVFANGSEYKKTYILNHLLRQEFGASTVVSIDYSDYEGANIIHDMNYPI